ncbi:MAG: sigma factor regulator FecR, partial [Desulfobacterales bacterium]
ETEVRRAAALAQSCDLFLVVGSTLLVQPAALLPDMAHRNGAFLAMVNLSKTPYDTVCDVRIQGKAGEILPQIADQVLAQRDPN